MKPRPLTLRTWRYSAGAVVFVAASLIAPGRGVGQTRQYVVTELSRGDAPGVPCKLNNFGDIAGRTGGALEGELRATVWNRSTFKAKHIGALLGGDYSSASDVNDVGEVVGVSNTGSAIVPFLWTGNGGPTIIPLLPGDSCGQATAMNKSGHVVGYSSGSKGARAFLWGRSLGVRDLGVLPGGSYSTASDVNDANEVVGTSGSSNGERAVLWTKAGNVRDLGTLPGDWASEAVAINNSGEVVGSSKGPGGTRAFVWSREDGMQELGVLPGGDSSRAMDINDSGEVVGSSANGMRERAFIWTKQKGIADLNSPASAALGFVFIEAHAINARGQIIVMGQSAHDSMIATATAAKGDHICSPAPPSSFLLTPVLSP
jgi:probable HAF family extracellular repeat protein